MARLVLGVAGAAVGFAIGGPQGAQLGFMAGSAIGGMLDPAQKVQGPRVADSKIQHATLGSMINIIYGSSRGAGFYLWNSDLIEVSQTESEDGKGGPRVETTSYSYFRSFAVSLGEGEGLGIEKIWANGRLIYNVGPDATAETLIASRHLAESMRFYSGSHTQMPDPTMEAQFGVGNVSAYRGQMYVVFDHFSLADYGNTLPNLEFKVVKTGDDTFALRETLSVPAYAGSAFTYLTTCVPFADGESVWRYQGQWDQTLVAPYRVKVFQLLNDGTPILYGQFQIDLGGGTSPAFARGNTDENLCAFYINGTFKYALYTSDGIAVSVFSSPTDMGTSIADKRFVKNGNYFVATNASVNYPIYRWLIDDEAGLPLSIPAVANKTVYGMSIIDDTLYVASRTLSAAVVIERYSLLDMSLLSSFSTGLSGTPTGLIALGDDEFLMDVQTATLYRVRSTGNTVVGGVATVLGLAADFTYANEIVYFSLGRQGVSNIDPTYIYANSIAGDDVSLASIVQDQCQRAGLSLAEINTTELDDAVHGFRISRQGSARQNISQLEKFAYFDEVDSGGAIKFVKRGADAVVTVEYEDLGAHEPGTDSPEALQITRGQELDLPRNVSVIYIDKDNDYQAGNEPSSRQVTTSQQEVSEELGIAMGSDKAAQIADVLLYDAHVARTGFGFSTTRKYAPYEPTDVMVVPSLTATYRLRITKKSESGPLIKWEAVADDATVYTSSRTGSTQQVAQVQIATPGPTRALFLDIPLVRDQDDDAGFYVPMTGFKDEWRGSTLFTSPDDIAFASVGSVMNKATLGTCDSVLGTWPGGNVFDAASSLDVTLISGELVSVTRDQALNGANAALVGDEIIVFRTATLIGSMQYRLSGGMLRGRRGTEQHVGTHAAGERFVLLSVAGTLRPNEGSNAIGAVRHYKAVSNGRKLSQTTSTSFTNTAVGLKPYAPTRLRGGKQANGDFVMPFNRRTRVDGGWRDFVDVGFGESISSFSMDIMNGSTVIRTIATSIESFTYTLAQQIADWGSERTSITVNMYQISATVGRGFAANKTY